MRKFLLLGAAVSVGSLPLGSTQADVDAQYAQVASTWKELQGAFAPLADTAVHSEVPTMLQGILDTATNFAESLEWAPHLASIGKLIDDVAWGPDAYAASDPRTGNGLNTADCKDGETCKQVVGATKEVIDAFKGNSMLIPPFFTQNAKAKASEPAPSPSPEPMPAP
jgi:hypothetical protein